MKPDGTEMAYDARTVQTANQFFLRTTRSNGCFLPLFTANGIKVSSSYENSADNVSTDREYSHDEEAKHTWFKCHGSGYKSNSNGFKTALCTYRDGNQELFDGNFE